jgi:hypothetical protein
VGQQPNIELEIADLPRPVPKPAPARAWKPQRPGELGGPEDMKWGAGFGTIGPDAGYALSLAAARSIDLAAGEHRHNADAAIATLAAARASLFGRSPTKHDIDLALVLLGYDASGLDRAVVNELAERRLRWFAAVGHKPGRLTEFVAKVDRAVLQLSADEARAKMAAGEQLLPAD